MIVPASVADLVAGDPLGATKAAIVARLAALIGGVKVVSHPGRLDVSEVVGREVTDAPAIRLGWSRVRASELMDGSFHMPVEFVAYVVARPVAIAGRRVEAEAVALAIGRRILQVLADRETSFWGRLQLTPPAETPPPEFRPIFTVADAAEGVAYYAVTWTQSLTDQGPNLFDAPAPAVTETVDADGRLSVHAEFGPDDADVPEMLRALWSDPDA